MKDISRSDTITPSEHGMQPMLAERDFIETLAKIHGSIPFLADAESVKLGGTGIIASTDSFSEREDFLAGLEPEAIGRLMAYGAAADILASGAKPECMVQVWNVDAAHDAKFYARVASGIQETMSRYGAKVLGGDIGTATEWCWTATVFAHSEDPIRRVASRRVDFDLYATGPLGAANAAVFLGRPIPLPELREPVPHCSLFATDTSGGLFDALENFRRVNAGMWLELDADHAVSSDAVRNLPPNVDAGWTLVGGVGEYELVFAVPAGIAISNCLKIGSGGFRDTDECDFRIMRGGRCGTMANPPPDYRAIPSEDWLKATAEYWATLGL